MILLLACSSEPPPPSVVVVTIDTLRADHVYDHPWVQTPELDALRAESLVFTRAVAAAPTTLASHTSMFTGLHPHSHGVPWNGTRVPEEQRLLAERLQEAGWDTGAVVGGFPLEARFGLDQGFDDYSGPWRDAEAVTDVALAWLGEHDEQAFLWVHYWDVHHPWVPPEPWDRMYREDDLELDPKREVGRYRGEIAMRKPGWEELDRALQGSYGGAVSYVDHHLGRLLDAVPEGAIVVVTADHGETHADHRNPWSHGVTVHDSVSRIPLLVRVPGWGTGVREELVSNLDLSPTLLDALGLPVGPMEGQSLRNAADRAVFSEATMPHRERRDGSWPNEGNCRGMWEGDWKLVHCPFFHRPAELFAMPDEDLPVEDPVEQRMLPALTRWAKTEPPLVAPMATDEGTLEQLEALGYVVR